MLVLLATLVLVIVPRAEPLAFATARSAYLEDDTGSRPIAEIRALLVGVRDRDYLVVVVAAIGPAVDGAKGWDGIVGANVVTARELERIRHEDRLRLAVDGRPAADFHLRVLSRAQVPVRRFDARAGRFVETATGRELPVALGVAVGPIPTGSHQTSFVVGGVPRLTIEHERTAKHARILAIESLSGRILR